MTDVSFLSLYVSFFSLFPVCALEQGYRVLVVEQTETPEQLELRRREKGSKDKVIFLLFYFLD